MKTIVIKNGHVIDPANGRDGRADILIEKGLITAVDDSCSIDTADHKVIDAEGLNVIPGLVDCCARLREPGLEQKARIKSETTAAAKSGITTLCCPPDTDPVVDEPAVVELIHQKAASAGKSHVVVLGALTQGLDGEQLSEMYALQKAGCVGLGNARRPVANTAIQKRAYAYAATFDIPVFIEPTDPWLSQQGCAHQGKIASRLGLKGIPVSAETIAIAQALELIAETGVRAHIGRISSARAVEMIARAKHEHLPVTADVSAHQLHLTEHDISNFNSDCHVIPPLRTQRDMEALRQAVADGTIDAISSDHQPHDFDAKQSPFAGTEPGISALETYLPLCMRLQELTSVRLPELITRMSTSPASILGIEAGTLSVGAVADICIYSDDDDWQLSQDNMVSQGRNTPFYGWNFNHRVRHTLVRGKHSYIYK